MRWIVLLLMAVLFLVACESYEVGKCAHYDDGFLGDRNPCWKYSAGETGDLSYCDNIESDGYRSLCYGEVAAVKNDRSLCNRAASFDNCIREFEDERLDIEIDECTSKWVGREDCLTDLAWEYEDTDPCRYVEDEVLCYAYVAKATGNANVCDRLGADEEADNAQACRNTLEELETPTIEEEEEEEEERECTFDDDCDNICEGDEVVYMMCDLNDYSCQEDRREDCTQQTDHLYADVSVTRICQNAECVLNEDVANQHRQQLSNLVKELTATKLELTQFMLDANKRCLNGLADVTNKLIIDTALLAGGVMSRGASAALVESRVGASMVAYPGSGKVMGMFSFALEETLDELSAATSGKMKPEDYIALNCKAYEQAGDDIKMLEWKIDKAQQYYREINDKVVLA